MTLESNPVSALDDVFHAKARLGLVTTLLNWGGQGDFRSLRETLDLSDGNLGSHLAVLERAGYVQIEKSFVGRRPRTTVRLTDGGRHEFGLYLARLEALVSAASAAIGPTSD